MCFFVEQRDLCGASPRATTELRADQRVACALSHRRTLELDGTPIQVAPVEYVIVRKLEYFREGGSQKHLRDIRSMLEISSDSIDQEQLAKLVAERGLAVEWQASVS